MARCARFLTCCALPCDAAAPSCGFVTADPTSLTFVETDAALAARQAAADAKKEAKRAAKAKRIEKKKQRAAARKRKVRRDGWVDGWVGGWVRRCTSSRWRETAERG